MSGDLTMVAAQRSVPDGPSVARLDSEATSSARRAPSPLLVGGIAIAIAALLPLLYLVVRALEADASAVETLARPRTVGVVLATLGLAVSVGIGTVALGVPIAWLTARTDLPGRRLWAIVTIVPLALPSYVTAFAFLAAFGPRGTLQGLLAPFGVERLPSIGGLVGASIVLMLVSFPYVTLATRSALLRLDPAIEESARLLGDRRMAVFRRITIPVIAPAVLAGALLAVLYALSDFGAVSLLQFDSLARVIHLRLGASFDRSTAAVLALVLVGLAVLVVWGERRIRARAGTLVPTAGRRPTPLVPLGSWRWPAMIFLSAVVGLAVVVPIGTIAWWLVRGLAGGDELRVAVEATRDTLFVAAVSAGIGVLLATVVAVLAGRFPSTLARSIETSVVAGFALPGIVVALAVVFLATRSVPFLYQTLALLIGVYAVRFVPQASGALRAAVRSTGEGAEEVARTLGDGPVRAFMRVTVPTLAPALVAGTALIFVTVAKELPLALILAPIGFETLATEVWDAASSGFYARAAVPAAILVGVSLAGVGLLLRAEDGTR